MQAALFSVTLQVQVDRFEPQECQQLLPIDQHCREQLIRLQRIQGMLWLQIRHMRSPNLPVVRQVLPPHRKTDSESLLPGRFDPDRIRFVHGCFHLANPALVLSE